MRNTGQLVTKNIAQKRQGVATAPRPSATYRSHQLEILPAIAMRLASIITNLPYCRLSSRLVDRLLQIAEGGAA